MKDKVLLRQFVYSEKKPQKTHTHTQPSAENQTAINQKLFVRFHPFHGIQSLHIRNE